MPCTKDTHNHQWPTSGVLRIERCEKYCGFCVGPARHRTWKYAWHVRRHVKDVHVKHEYPDLVVDEDWTVKDMEKAQKQAVGYQKRKQAGKVTKAKKPEKPKQALQLSSETMAAIMAQEPVPSIENFEPLPNPQSPVKPSFDEYFDLAMLMTYQDTSAADLAPRALTGYEAVTETCDPAFVYNPIADDTLGTITGAVLPAHEFVMDEALPPSVMVYFDDDLPLFPELGGESMDNDAAELFGYYL